MTKTAKRLARQLLENAVVTGSATALIIRFAAALMGLAMFALAARQMEPAAFGTLAMIFNTMSFLSVAVVCGQETLIARSWGEYYASGQPGLARGAVTFGASVTFAAALISSLAVASIWLTLRPPSDPLLPIASAAFLFTATLMTFNGMFTLVAVGLRASELSREVFYRFAVVVVILAHAAMHLQFTPTDFFFSLAAALFAALIYQGWRVSRSVPEEVKRATPQFKIATWRRRSIGMWLSSLLDTSSQFLDVIVVGFVIGPTGAAFYFSATRITNVFAMIAGGITNYATGHISKLFHVDAKEELQGVLKSLAIISTLLGVGAFLTIVIFGKFVLSLYGPAYVEMYPALIVLALGTLFTALAGPAPYLLLLTGHERVYPRIMGAGVLLKLGLIAILGPWFGVMGAAIAASTSTALTAIALVAACRRTTKLDPSSATALRGVHRLDGWRTANIKRAA